MEEKSLDFLFNNVSLYTKEKFEIFKLEEDEYHLNKEEFEKFKKYIGINKEKIITYCHKCKKEFPFNIQVKYIDFMTDINFTTENMIITENFANVVGGRVDVKKGKIWGAMPPYKKEKLYNNKIWYIEYLFECTNNSQHRYLMMISIELKDGCFIVRKIGQNPSMLTIKGFDFDKYKNILEKLNAYDDYKKADLSNADHFFVGAYAYLRRIFEKLILFYLGEAKLDDNHMDTKINFVKDKFDPRIRGLLKNLYGILSKSIHELDEDESKEYYIYLKTVIDMQLEYMNTEEEKEKQSKRLGKILNKIAGMIQ